MYQCIQCNLFTDNFREHEKTDVCIVIRKILLTLFLIFKLQNDKHKKSIKFIFLLRTDIDIFCALFTLVTRSNFLWCTLVSDIFSINVDPRNVGYLSSGIDRARGKR